MLLNQLDEAAAIGMGDCQYRILRYIPVLSLRRSEVPHAQKGACFQLSRIETHCRVYIPDKYPGLKNVSASEIKFVNILHI
jgi:hypothetical protein